MSIERVKFAFKRFLNKESENEFEREGDEEEEESIECKVCRAKDALRQIHTKRGTRDKRERENENGMVNVDCVQQFTFTLDRLTRVH